MFFEIALSEYDFFHVALKLLKWESCLPKNPVLKMKGREGEKLHPLCWHFKEGIPSERQSQGRGCLTDRTGPRAPCILFNKEAFCGQSCRSVNYPDWARAGAVYWALLLSRPSRLWIPSGTIHQPFDNDSVLQGFQSTTRISSQPRAAGAGSRYSTDLTKARGKRVTC